ncbi:MAG TPA: hypothetical protein VKR58_00070 [Aquella sp.]|nr:hypothetical protein [Aquella sp.]
MSKQLPPGYKQTKLGIIPNTKKIINAKAINWTNKYCWALRF